MGPFELMDLVGVDVGPRRVALVLRAELRRAALAAVPDHGQARSPPGGMGRKSGARLLRLQRRHPASTARRTPNPLPAGGGDGVVVIAGESPLAVELRAAAARGRLGGRRARGGRSTAAAVPDPRPRPAGEEPDAPLQGGPQAICCAAGSLAALDPGGARRRVPRAAAARGARARRADARPGHAPTRPPTRPSGSSRRSASTRSGSATPRASCSGGSSARSSTRRRSRSARASAAPRTSTPAWSTGSTTRAGSARVGRPDRARPRAGVLDALVRGAPRGALSRGAGAAPAGVVGPARAPDRRGLLQRTTARRNNESRHLPGAARGPRRGATRTRSSTPRTTRSSRSRPAASAARTCTSTTGA